jgi:hypothetical protein
LEGKVKLREDKWAVAGNGIIALCGFLVSTVTGYELLQPLFDEPIVFRSAKFGVEASGFLGIAMLGTLFIGGILIVVSGLKGAVEK